MSLFGGKHRAGESGDAGKATGAPAGDLSHPAGTEAAAETPRSPAGTFRGSGAVANIGKSISIKGDLTGNEDIVIEGTVDGKVDLPSGQLTIGSNGTVKGEIQAKSVVVVGRVQGNVTGTERIEIQGTGTVEGDVTAPRLVVAEGAAINGTIQMGKPEASGASARPPAVAAGEARKAI